MFVYTVKWNRATALIIVIVAALVIIGIVLAVGAAGRGGKTTTVRDNADRVSFLQSCGWEVEEEPVSERTIVIPKDFSDIYTEYNKLQIAQGYDLSRQCGLEATIYTYRVLNYSGYSGNVVAELYVLNFEIIGGDVHSLELDGFMHGLRLKK